MATNSRVATALQARGTADGSIYSNQGVGQTLVPNFPRHLGAQVTETEEEEESNRSVRQ